MSTVLMNRGYVSVGARESGLVAGRRQYKVRMAVPGALRILGPMGPSSATAYPRDREAEIVLRDGSTVHVRPVRSEDRPAIRSFLEALSPGSIGFRCFGTPSLEWATDWSLDVDYADRFAPIAESGGPRQIVAHAACLREDAERAEVAFLVADRWQGKGISTVSLAHLVEAAEARGITTFTAQCSRTTTG
jgi:GNAT superfamily N-acetyltransferase